MLTKHSLTYGRSCAEHTLNHGRISAVNMMFLSGYFCLPTDLLVSVFSRRPSGLRKLRGREAWQRNSRGRTCAIGLRKGGKRGRRRDECGVHMRQMAVRWIHMPLRSLRKSPIPVHLEALRNHLFQLLWINF